MTRAAERTLPLPLLLALLVAGAVAGWAALEVTDSMPAALAAAALVSWGGVLLARRVRSARGRRDSRELLSGDFETSSGLRSYVTRVVPLLAFLVGWGVIAGLLSAFGLDGPELGGLDPAEALAFVLAAPLWLDTDTRLTVRAARKRAEEAERMLAATDPARAPAPRGTAREEWKARSHAARLELRRSGEGTDRLPAGGWRAWVLSLSLIAGGLVSAFVLGFDGSEDVVTRLIGLGVGVGLVVLGSMLVRVVLSAPYFVDLTPTGIDLMGAGEIPWDQVSSVSVTADSGLKFLSLGLVPQVPRAEPWYTAAHARLSRRVGERAVAATLLFCPRPAETVLGAIRARTRVPVDVDID